MCLCVLKALRDAFVCEKSLFSIIWNLTFGCEFIIEGGLGRSSSIKFACCCELSTFEYKKPGHIYINLLICLVRETLSFS